MRQTHPYRVARSLDGMAVIAHIAGPSRHEDCMRPRDDPRGDWQLAESVDAFIYVDAAGTDFGKWRRQSDRLALSAS